jgi:hypothetical protein
MDMDKNMHSHMLHDPCAARRVARHALVRL